MYEENVLITPGKAKKMLLANAENQRKMKETKIAEYVEMMLAGQWVYPTGECLKIDVDGRIIDGQNRLQAVIDSGVATRFDIKSGLPREAQLVIDSGAVRTGGDVLAIFGTPERDKAAAVVRWWLLWDRGHYRGSSGRGGYSPSRMQVITTYQSDAGNFDAAAMRGADASRHKLGAAGPAAMAYYLFHRLDADQAHTFFDQVIGGEGLAAHAPAKTLRERLLTNKVSRDPWARPEILAGWIRGWNAFRKDRTLSQILITSSGKLTNTNFPIPR